MKKLYVWVLEENQQNNFRPSGSGFVVVIAESKDTAINAYMELYKTNITDGEYENGAVEKLKAELEQSELWEIPIEGDTAIYISAIHGLLGIPKF